MAKLQTRKKWSKGRVKVRDALINTCKKKILDWVAVTMCNT